MHFHQAVADIDQSDGAFLLIHPIDSIRLLLDIHPLLTWPFSWSERVRDRARTYCMQQLAAAAAQRLMDSVPSFDSNTIPSLRLFCFSSILRPRWVVHPLFSYSAQQSTRVYTEHTHTHKKKVYERD